MTWLVIPGSVAPFISCAFQGLITDSFLLTRVYEQLAFYSIEFGTSVINSIMLRYIHASIISINKSPLNPSTDSIHCQCHYRESLSLCSLIDSIKLHGIAYVAQVCSNVSHSWNQSQRKFVCCLSIITKSRHDQGLVQRYM